MATSKRGKNFNPRSLHGERLRKLRNGSALAKFQSTLPARGATGGARDSSDGRRISIHAPCTGSDPLQATDNRQREHFNPRSLHGERPVTYTTSFRSPTFQSTLPARGATKLLLAQPVREPFQSTLPARGATMGISKNRESVEFQSTLPARGATSARA